jgi:hypothetical protein
MLSKGAGLNHSNFMVDKAVELSHDMQQREAAASVTCTTEPSIMKSPRGGGAGFILGTAPAAVQSLTVGLKPAASRGADEPTLSARTLRPTPGVGGETLLDGVYADHAEGAVLIARHSARQQVQPKASAAMSVECTEAINHANSLFGQQSPSMEYIESVLAQMEDDAAADEEQPSSWAAQYAGAVMLLGIPLGVSAVHIPLAHHPSRYELSRAPRSTQPKMHLTHDSLLPLQEMLLAALRRREMPSACQACVRSTRRHRNTGVGFVAFADRFDVVAALVSRWLPVDGAGSVVKMVRCTLRQMEEAMEVREARFLSFRHVVRWGVLFRSRGVCVCARARTLAMHSLRD